jgi:hypothetical protein
MTGKQKLNIIHQPRESNHSLFVFRVPQEGFEPLSSAQKACRPTNLATDPLGKLIPLLLVSPAEGPAVHVPPPANFVAVLGFVARSAWKVGCFPSHLVRNRPCIADWNKR